MGYEAWRSIADMPLFPKPPYPGAQRTLEPGESITITAQNPNNNAGYLHVINGLELKLKELQQENDSLGKALNNQAETIRGLQHDIKVKNQALGQRQEFYAVDREIFRLKAGVLIKHGFVYGSDKLNRDVQETLDKLNRDSD